MLVCVWLLVVPQTTVVTVIDMIVGGVDSVVGVGCGGLVLSLVLCC